MVDAANQNSIQTSEQATLEENLQWSNLIKILGWVLGLYVLSLIILIGTVVFLNFTKTSQIRLPKITSEPETTPSPQVPESRFKLTP